MGIFRRLPRTDEENTIAINKAFVTLGIVLPAEVTLTTATKNRLIAVHTGWNTANDNIDISEFAKTTVSALVFTSKENASMWIRHFYMVFNFGVERGVYTAAQRSFFHLDVNSDALPPLGTEEEITLWGNRIVTGDANRIAAGGAPMVNPTAAEVGAALSTFVNANNDQVVKTAAWKATLLIRTNLRPEAEAVILKVWDESETFYNELPAPTKRDKCRPWGVFYMSDVEVTINLTIVNDTTSAPIDAASTYFVEGNTTHLSNPLGIVQIKTTVADRATLVTDKTGFVQNTQVVDFVTGVTVYSLEIRMIPV